MTDPSMPEYRAELRRLLDHVTPTPWVTTREETQYGHVTNIASTRTFEVSGVLGRELVATNSLSDDAELIVAAVNALPTLLDALDEAEEKASELFDAAVRHKLRAMGSGTALNRVRALADDMETWCSPHGISVEYAKRIREALDGDS